MRGRQFQTSCERMRLRALRDGEGSPADRTWRRHAEHCPECRASLHILELLSAESESTSYKSYKLNPEDASHLVEVARKRFQVPYRRRVVRSLMSASWKVAIKVAIIVALLAVIGALLPGEWLMERGVTWFAGAAGHSIVSSEGSDSIGSGYYFIPLNSGEREMERAVASASSPFEAACMPEVIPGQSVDRAIRNIRKEISDSIEELNCLIDHDLTGY